MKGEETLYQFLLLLKDHSDLPLFQSTISLLATMYKNTISLTDLTTSKAVLNILINALSQSLPVAVEKKYLYAINILLAGKKEIGEAFLAHDGMQIIEKVILGQEKELKRKGLALYKSLVLMFGKSPVLATSNICSQTLLDLTAIENQEDYPLVQSYLELLRYVLNE